MPQPTSDSAQAPLEVSVRRIHRRDLNRVWEFLKLVFRDVNRETVEYQRPRSKRRFLEVYEEEGVEQLLFEVRRPDRRLRRVRLRDATGDDNWINERYFDKHDMRPLFVEELAVHPGYQGRGVGSFMLEQLEHLARVRGCTHLVLEVAENNEHALRCTARRNFYKLDAAIFLAQEGADGARAAAAAEDRRAAPSREGHRPLVSAEAVARDVAAICEQGFVIVPDLLSARGPGPHAARARAASRRPAARSQRLRGPPHAADLLPGGRGADLRGPRRASRACSRSATPSWSRTISSPPRRRSSILPGETPQPFHTDDTFYRIARPRDAVSLSTIVAIDAFTRENGATQVVPGSHRWGDADVENLLDRIDFETVPDGERVPNPASPLPDRLRGRVEDVAMPAGAAIVFLGTLVHRGGENRSDRSRLALSNQYCQPWARTQENYFLSIPYERVREMSSRVQALLGYSIHPPFMGHANGLHPRRVLER